MEIQHDRTTSDSPWTDPKPVPPNAIPDDAHYEGGFAYWIKGVAPDLHIMCAGAGFGPYEVIDSTAEYPDEIYIRRAALLEEYERKSP